VARRKSRRARPWRSKVKMSRLRPIPRPSDPQRHRRQLRVCVCPWRAPLVCMRPMNHTHTKGTKSLRGASTGADSPTPSAQNPRI
jgi:hypothetical protein